MPLIKQRTRSRPTPDPHPSSPLPPNPTTPTTSQPSPTSRFSFLPLLSRRISTRRSKKESYQSFSNVLSIPPSEIRNHVYSVQSDIPSPDSLSVFPPLFSRSSGRHRRNDGSSLNGSIQTDDDRRWKVDETLGFDGNGIQDEHSHPQNSSELVASQSGTTKSKTRGRRRNTLNLPMMEIPQHQPVPVTVKITVTGASDETFRYAPTIPDRVLEIDRAELAGQEGDEEEHHDGGEEDEKPWVWEGFEVAWGGSREDLIYNEEEESLVDQDHSLFTTSTSGQRGRTQVSSSQMAQHSHGSTHQPQPSTFHMGDDRKEDSQYRQYHSANHLHPPALPSLSTHQSNHHRPHSHTRSHSRSHSQYRSNSQSTTHHKRAKPPRRPPPLLPGSLSQTSKRCLSEWTDPADRAPYDFGHDHYHDAGENVDADEFRAIEALEYLSGMLSPGWDSRETFVELVSQPGRGRESGRRRRGESDVVPPSSLSQEGSKEGENARRSESVEGDPPTRASGSSLDTVIPVPPHPPQFKRPLHPIHLRPPLSSTPYQHPTTPTRKWVQSFKPPIFSRNHKPQSRQIEKDLEIEGTVVVDALESSSSHKGETAGSGRILDVSVTSISASEDYSTDFPDFTTPKPIGYTASIKDVEEYPHIVPDLIITTPTPQKKAASVSDIPPPIPPRNPGRGAPRRKIGRSVSEGVAMRTNGGVGSSHQPWGDMDCRKRSYNRYSEDGPNLRSNTTPPIHQRPLPPLPPLPPLTANMTKLQIIPQSLKAKLRLKRPSNSPSSRSGALHSPKGHDRHGPVRGTSLSRKLSSSGLKLRLRNRENRDAMVSDQTGREGRSSQRQSQGEECKGDEDVSPEVEKRDRDQICPTRETEQSNLDTMEGDRHIISPVELSRMTLPPQNSWQSPPPLQSQSSISSFEHQHRPHRSESQTPNPSIPHPRSPLLSATGDCITETITPSLEIPFQPAALNQLSKLNTNFPPNSTPLTTPLSPPPRRSSTSPYPLLTHLRGTVTDGQTPASGTSSHSGRIVTPSSGVLGGPRCVADLGSEGRGSMSKRPETFLSLSDVGAISFPSEGAGTGNEHHRDEFERAEGESSNADKSIGDVGMERVRGTSMSSLDGTSSLYYHGSARVSSTPMRGVESPMDRTRWLLSKPRRRISNEDSSR